MSRIRIEDLSSDLKLSREDMLRVTGGMMPSSTTGGSQTMSLDIHLAPASGGPVPNPYPNVGSDDVSGGTSDVTITDTSKTGEGGSDSGGSEQ